MLCMRYYSFLLLVFLVSIYSGCNKQNDAVGPVSKKSGFSPQRTDKYDTLNIHFSAAIVCGTYVVYGSYTPNDGDNYIPVINDTITIAQYGDSSIICNSLAQFTAFLGNNPVGYTNNEYNWGVPCSYPAPQGNDHLYPSTYLFMHGDPMGHGVAIYFPAAHLDSIYIDAGYTGGGCNEYVGFLLRGVKIR